MDEMNRLDVLIVYSKALATSASNSSIRNITPFPKKSKNESYNIVYGYFLEICKRLHLKAGFSTSGDIIGPGSCRSFWTYKNKKWARVNSPCYSKLIFDKFSPVNEESRRGRNLLFSDTSVKPFNDPYLFGLFFDKQKTFDKLANFGIPTVSIDYKDIESVTLACRVLQRMVAKNKFKNDFGEEVVMKDRFGSGGRHVWKFEADDIGKMARRAKRNTKVSFIIQPFVKFDKGFNYGKLKASTDIRLVYLNGRVVQCYIRVAKNGDFRCNEHRGGLLTYITQQEIPADLVKKSNQIAKRLDKQCSLFTLDFLISNNGNSYLLEGNTGPGLDWNMSLKRNEIEAKKLIRLVVKELAVRANVAPTSRKELVVVTYPVLNVPPIIYPTPALVNTL
jgi:glutathione synthase/RimK-type ligase-like ATP-grasp enzyme